MIIKTNTNLILMKDKISFSISAKKIKFSIHYRNCIQVLMYNNIIREQPIDFSILFKELTIILFISKDSEWKLV